MPRLSSTVLVAVAALVLSACAAGGAAGQPTGAGGSAASSKPAPAAASKPAGAASKPAATQAASAPADEYFAGKTLTLLVNYSAGGPTDIFARMLSPHLERHIPGRPRIVVENRAGAGGVIGANQVYNAQRRDGLTLGVFTSPTTAQLLQGEGVQYDIAGFLWVGAVSETSVHYVSPSTGVASPRDMLSPRGEVIVGGLSPESSKDMFMRTYLNLLGVRYKYVTGYPGQADVVLAYRRGEVNYGEDSLTSWIATVVPMVREGQAVAVGQRGIIRNGQVVRDPRAADLPTFVELAAELKGEGVKQTIDHRALVLLAQMNAVTRALVYPPGTSPEVVEVMRKAMADTFADREFQAASEQQLGIHFEFMSGAEAQDLAQLTVNTTNNDPEALEYLKRMAREK
jgi:tripartite-type tricarboxylate transporter receptor subunit TctC